MEEQVTRNLSARKEAGERDSGVRECVREEESEDPPVICEQLGSYEVLEPLGSGAMGHIYRARHVVLGRLVAIKVLRPELAGDQAHLDRFIAEARAVNLLHHPHVIDVMDIGIGPEPMRRPWFVMELLEGVDVARLLIQQPIDVARALQIMRQVCEALEAIHAAGIVHRDVKPENIFLTQQDGRDFVKLIDFGVTRLSEPPPPATSDRQDDLVGTPRYMAPEQIGDHPLDHRADLYAVGSVLFELISGNPPFDADDLDELLQRVMCRRPPRLSSRVTLPVAVRDDLDHLLAHCLEKRACDRPNSAREVIESIDEIVARLSPTSPPPPARLPAPIARIHDRPMLMGDAAPLPAVPRRAPAVVFVTGGALAAMALCVGALIALDEAVPPPLAAQVAAPAPAPATAEPLGEEAVEDTDETPLVDETVLRGVEIPSTLEISAEQRGRRHDLRARRRARAELAQAQPILTVTAAREPVQSARVEPLDRDGVLNPFQ